MALERPVLAQRRTADAEEGTELQLGWAWLLKLRWGAVAGQLIALAFARALLTHELPYWPLLGAFSF